MKSSKANVTGAKSTEYISYDEAAVHDVLESKGVNNFYIKISEKYYGTEKYNMIEVPRYRNHDDPVVAYRPCKVVFTKDKVYRRIGTLNRVEINLHVDP